MAGACARDGELDGFDGRGNIALWRPSLDIREGCAPQIIKAGGIGGCFLYQFGESVDVAAAKDELRGYGSDKVSRGTGAVACRGGAAAAHGFIHDQAKRLKFGG